MIFCLNKQTESEKKKEKEKKLMEYGVPEAISSQSIEAGCGNS